MRPVFQLTAKYVAGVLPAFFKLCSLLEALKIIEPGPAFTHLPCDSVSTVPSLMSTSSSFG